jgi:hypothetical protein
MNPGLGFGWVFNCLYDFGHIPTLSKFTFQSNMKRIIVIVRIKMRCVNYEEHAQGNHSVYVSDTNALQWLRI